MPVEPHTDPEISLRDETTEDASSIEKVTTAAFLTAPHTSHTEQHIVAALRDAGQLTVSLLAEAAGGVVGHVAVSPVTLSSGEPDWFGLGPVSVLPARQGQGIGSRLIREALRRLQAAGAAGCVVLGEPGFYGRFGFGADPGVVLPGVPPAYFQVLAFGTRRTQGSVTYHAAFQA